MKIGIVLYPTFGGSGVVGTELGKALAAKGHQIHFITYSQPVRLGSFRENIYYHEVAVSDYPLFEYQPYETELTSKMVDVVKYEKLDLLHVHYAIPHASAAFMTKQICVRKESIFRSLQPCTETDITLVGKDPSFEPVITFCINESDAVTAVLKVCAKAPMNILIPNARFMLFRILLSPVKKEVQNTAKCVASMQLRKRKFFVTFPISAK
jgi:L-malate glycosyltransferase